MDSDSESESKLISLITQLMSIEGSMNKSFVFDSKFTPLISQIISLVSSIDLDSQPKPESELMSLVKQTISLFNSLDLDSQPKPEFTNQTTSVIKSSDLDSERKLLLELITLITQLGNSKDSEWNKIMLAYMLEKIFILQGDPDFLSLIHKILSLVISMNSKWGKLISLCPQVQVSFYKGKLDVVKEVRWRSCNKWKCLPFNWVKFRLRKEEDAIATHFSCKGCYGKNHKEYEKAPLEIKHPLHPKHSLQLVLLSDEEETKKCYCCDEDLIQVFYCCLGCDFAINVACVEKLRVLSIDHPKWHEHTLALFPSLASFPCNLCALADSTSCPFYLCPPCDFVVHQRCLNLPRVIRISRHPHRISFTSSFDQGDWSCGVCRKKIDNDYGGYSCIKDGSSYVTHSKCATQRNVWDGIDLEGVPKEIEEVEPPFMRIDDRIIQHFSHAHHHLRLDEKKSIHYDDHKLCQACITPIYFGNFYSCMQCDFNLHEECANISRKIHHPIHAHMLTLLERIDNVVNDAYECAACPRLCTAGFLYECSKQGCTFRLHAQCATITEPLVHESHMHPLYLTTKPEEWRTCCICQGSIHCRTNETFNCIEYECDFTLCFGCATIPHKVRYKHDNHILTLYYGEKTSQETYWCEACESGINPNYQRFYRCDEYCCVTLHIECLIGRNFYMKPGSSWVRNETKVDVLPNSHHMSRPICSICKKRCPYKIVFQSSGSVFCSELCLASCFHRVGYFY